MSYVSVAQKSREVQTAIIAMLESVTGLTCILANQSGPRPDLPYLAMEMLSSGTRIGGHIDEARYKETNGDGDNIYTIISHERVTCSVQAYGKPAPRIADQVRATDILIAIKNALSKPSVRQGLSVQSIAVLELGPVTDISKELETEVEPRANLDIILGYAYTEEDKLGQITTASIAETS